MAEYIDKVAFENCKPCKAGGKDHNGCWCRACWVDDKISAENIIQGDFDCSAINQWRSVFVEKEDCQKYCDWLNAEEMKI